jgi:hypothetical protein
LARIRAINLQAVGNPDILRKPEAEHLYIPNFVLKLPNPAPIAVLIA